MYLQSWDLVWPLQLVCWFSCLSPSPSSFPFLVGFQSFPQSCSHWTQGGVPWLVCLLRRVNKRVYISWATWQLAFQFNYIDPLLGTTLYCTVSFPDCHNSRKRVWCSEQHFLSQGVGPMRKKYHNCILHLNFKLSHDCMEWLTNKSHGSLFYLQFGSKYKRLCLHI